MGVSAGRIRLRGAIFVLSSVVLLMVYAFAFPGASAVRAQDAQPEDNGKPAETEQPQQQQTQQQTSLFMHMIQSVGPIFGIIFLAISITLVAIIVLLSMDLRMGMAIPPGFVEDFTDTVNKRRFKEAYEMARAESSYLGRVLTTGMSRLQYGVEDAREAAFNMVDSIKASKDQLIAYLAVIGTLGPLLGLVGTVYGMIRAFRTLSSSKVDPGRLAGDISHALVVTLVGVALAVPAIFCHTFFKSRLMRIGTDTGNMADDLLTQMYHNSRKPAVSTPADPRVAAPTGVKAAE
jgi:biopolymer transport protein ExbB